MDHKDVPKLENYEYYESVCNGDESGYFASSITEHAWDISKDAFIACVELALTSDEVSGDNWEIGYKLKKYVKAAKLTDELDHTLEEIEPDVERITETLDGLKSPKFRELESQFQSCIDAIDAGCEDFNGRDPFLELQAIWENMKLMKPVELLDKVYTQ